MADSGQAYLSMAYAEKLLGYFNESWGEGHVFGSWVAMVYGLPGSQYADFSKLPAIWLSPLDERGKIDKARNCLEIFINDSGKLVFSVVGQRLQNPGSSKLTKGKLKTGSLSLQFSNKLEADAAAVMELFDGLAEIASEGELVAAGGDRPDHAEEDTTAPEKAEKSWRDAKTDEEVVKLFPPRPKYDELIDLHAMAKERRSNKLMNLVKARSSYAENRVKALVKNLLQ